jgi:Rubisco LSMT substrate-binding
VFEDFGGQHEALVVRNAGEANAPADSQPIASRAATQHPAADVSAGQESEAAAAAAASSSLACSSATMVLQGVRVLSIPGAHSLLDFGGATVCYSVGNTPEHGSQYGPGLVEQCTHAPTGAELGSCRSDQSATQHDAAGKPEEDTGARPRDGGQLPEARHERPPARLEAGVEAALCWRVARDAQALLSSFPTSIEGDQALLRRAGPEPGIASAAYPESAASWSAWTHMQLALRYRLARKHLLQGVIADLECQARMVSDGDATDLCYKW